MILFVDDESRRMDPYVETCELSGLETRLIQSVDEAWEFLQGNLAAVELLVLDVMLPTGDRYGQAETVGGIRTGVAFFHDVRTLSAALPVIILTQSNDPEIDNVFDNKPRTRLEKKHIRTPSELVDIIRDMLDGAQA